MYTFEDLFLLNKRIFFARNQINVVYESIFEIETNQISCTESHTDIERVHEILAKIHTMY